MTAARTSHPNLAHKAASGGIGAFFLYVLGCRGSKKNKLIRSGILVCCLCVRLPLLLRCVGTGTGRRRKQRLMTIEITPDHLERFSCFWEGRKLIEGGGQRRATNHNDVVLLIDPKTMPRVP